MIIPNRTDLSQDRHGNRQRHSDQRNRRPFALRGLQKGQNSLCLFGFGQQREPSICRMSVQHRTKADRSTPSKQKDQAQAAEQITEQHLARRGYLISLFDRTLRGQTQNRQYAECEQDTKTDHRRRRSWAYLLHKLQQRSNLLPFLAISRVPTVAESKISLSIAGYLGLLPKCLLGIDREQQSVAIICKGGGILIPGGIIHICSQIRAESQCHRLRRGKNGIGVDGMLLLRRILRIINANDAKRNLLQKAKSHIICSGI